MSKKIEVTVTHRFKASPERVYDAWLDPDKVRAWSSLAGKKLGLAGEMSRVEVDPVVGGAFLFSDIRDGVEACHWGTYLELERPQKITFTWITDQAEESDPSIVRITIQPDGEGSQVTLVHEVDSKWAEYEEQTKMGWNAMLRASAGE